MRALTVLPLILAGGRGERLYPLTTKRCKPAVPFGGGFRVIDFSLMNWISSGLRVVYILTQYLAEPLRRHVMERWTSAAPGCAIELLPPCGPERCYRGTADAVYQNLGLFAYHRPSDVLILAADHVYRADYQKLFEIHRGRDADVTVLTGKVDAASASSFGVLGISENSRITQFVEKPANPAMFAKDGKCPINLGVYCFRATYLLDQLLNNEKDQSSHDFGKDILPASVRSGRVYSCPLGLISTDARPYWRDVGCIDSFFEANMDLLGCPPAFELDSPRWSEIPGFREWLPLRQPSMSRIGGNGGGACSLFAKGARASGAALRKCILFPGVVVDRGAHLEECILFPDARVGTGARLSRVVVEEGVSLPPGTEVGPGSSPPALATSPNGVTIVTGSLSHAPSRVGGACQMS